ncbi:MAG: PadR family transcriptional regulator [Chloroflexota bacterium]
MSLVHAILGFLNKLPMTGYDLKTESFDQSVAHFWPADQAQIYRTLDKLTEQGFVESTIEVQTDRPNRKVYHITEAGRTELFRWLALPQSELPIHREPFLVQLFFADQVDPKTVFKLLEVQLDAHEKQLAKYREIPLPSVGTPGLSREFVFERLTLNMGIHNEQMYIDWLKESIKIVQQLGE